MSINKIVVGVDFSPESEVAIEQALDIARQNDASIILLHVAAMLSDVVGVPDSIESTAAAYGRLLEDRLAEDRKQLAELRERFSGQGPTISHMVIEKYPDTGIAEAASELEADLIVVGTHGRTGVRRFIIGSVAERVARLSSTNVLIARPTKEPKRGYRNILVPTDFEETASDVLQTALDHAAPGAHVTLLHSWAIPPLSSAGMAETGSPLPDALFENISKDIEARGTEMAKTHQREGIKLEFKSLNSSPSHGIQTWIENNPCDLVVMGSHGRRGMRRLVLGSVSEQTVRHAPCSVLVVHKKRD